MHLVTTQLATPTLLNGDRGTAITVREQVARSVTNHPGRERSRAIETEASDPTG